MTPLTKQTKKACSLPSATYSNLESEGDLIFDETSLTTEQAVEKHWKIQEELVVLQSSVIKNGDIYEATIEMSNGIALMK